MKTLIATACIVALTLAEPPPSNSYLPPSAAGRSGGGYPQGPHGGAPGFGGGQFGEASQVIAARTLDHGAGAHGAGAVGHGGHGGIGGHGGGLARNAAHGHGPQAKFGAGAIGFGAGAQGHGDQGYDQNASPFGRNALEESGEPANYNFGYMVNDYQEGTDFGHHEERQDERAEGEYHVVLPDGRKQTVSYEADERGFKPHISYEDSDDLARSGGYDANANNIQGRGGSHGNHGDGFKNGGHGSHGNARSSGY